MLNELFYFLFYTFMAIFPIANPIGMSPFFHSLTKQYNQPLRRDFAKRVAIYSFFVCWVTLLVGSWILKFFNISIPLVQIAGGIIVFLSALGMLSSRPKLTTEEKKETLSKEGDVAFFPLTMPLTTGAGTLAMSMSIGGSIIGAKFNFVNLVSQLIGATLGIVLLAFSIYICYYFADRIFARLGKVGTDVVTQVSSFILLSVSIKIIWEGVRGLLMI